MIYHSLFESWSLFRFFFHPQILSLRGHSTSRDKLCSRPISCQRSPRTIGFWVWPLVQKLWDALDMLRLFFQSQISALKEPSVSRDNSRPRPILCQLSRRTIGFWLWRLVQELGRVLDPGSQIPGFSEALILTLREHRLKRTYRRSRPILCQLFYGTIGFWVWRLPQKLGGALGHGSQIPDFFQALILTLREQPVGPTYRRSRPTLYQLSSCTIWF